MTSLARCAPVVPFALLALLLLGPRPGVAQEKLKFSFFAPPAHNHYQNVIMPWAEEIKKRTGGKVELTLFALYMNKAKYQALPADVRRVLDETTAPGASAWKRIGEVWDRAEGAGRKLLVDQGHEVITLSKEERRRWQRAARPLDEKFAADLEAKGLPGRALVKEARDLSIRYGEAD
jgi:TRAP-type C4-dicarboxylate transport system substrate-binding protein